MKKQNFIIPKASGGRRATTSKLVFHDSSLPGDDAQNSAKRPLENNTPDIILEALATMLSDDDDETAAVPPFYINAQGTRVPSLPLEHMPDEKRAKLYASSSSDDYAARRCQLNQQIISFEEKLIGNKKHLMGIRVDMRHLLQQYIEAARERTELICNLQSALQAQNELDKRHLVPK